MEEPTGRHVEVVTGDDLTADQQERERRKIVKAERHAELKADAQAAVEVEGVPAEFIKRINEPAVGHHPRCSCFRCKPPKTEGGK